MVRTLKGQSTSTSDSDSDSEDGQNIRRHSVSSRKVHTFHVGKCLIHTCDEQVVSVTRPQNVVYKTKKCVQWITRNNEENGHTDVFFYTARKAAVKQLSALLARSTANIIVCLHSLSFSLVRTVSHEIHFHCDQNIQINKGKEFGLLSIDSPGAQWSLLVNGSWRYLGSELSALIETAWQNGEAALNAAHFLKVCFTI